MFNLSDDVKTPLKLVAIAICLIACFYGGKIFQSNDKAMKLYSAAMEDYKNHNYSNAYYLFSKINSASGLKIAALYRQALCARALDDLQSEELVYRSLVKYPQRNNLTNEARYKLGQILADKKPLEAIKYFNEVIHSDAEDDYKAASEYYVAKIEAKNSAKSDSKNVEKSFRNYLQRYPNGRLATDVINTWLEYNEKITQKDLLLIARSYNSLGNYNSADKILSDIEIKNSWAVLGKNSIDKGEKQKGKSVIIDGIGEYADNAVQEDYKKAILAYLETEDDYYSSLSFLLNKAKGKYKDYIWNLKCKYAPNSYKLGCYEQFYANFPKSDYAQNAMENIMLARITNKNYGGAKTIADDYILKYPDSENIDMVMFWRAKIEQKYTHNPQFDILYRNVINNFPDSYYAYRAFWLVKSLATSVIPTTLELKPVEYPYQYPARDKLLYKLILVNDFDLIKKITNDEFIKSWAEYKQGNYMTSVYTAQKAMDKMKHKPPKSDVRWRLVYPMNYYNQIKSNADKYSNDLALMMAITREESHFNTYAQSGVGAIGLMQLMPATAHDIGTKYALNFNTSDLFNPELNIKLGNLYYSSLRKMTKNMDISAIAAYNGGIGSVQRWKTNLKYSDTDEFVEQIPYDETRHYVKKIFKSYWNYIRIYQK